MMAKAMLESKGIDRFTFMELKPARLSYYVTVALLIALIVLGAVCAYTMEHAGHHITGMTNQVVWGLPHVFAVFLIVCASGALNTASLSSVFGHDIHKPYARMSIVLSITLLVGGLLVLVLDLGRPDRLIIAMTTFNFRSIFAWNVFLYTGFIAIAIVYLWVQMEARHYRYVRLVGGFALVWRLALTTATGSIFGFLVGRNALDSALLAPMFIAMSLAFGTASFGLLAAASRHWAGTHEPAAIRRSMARLLLVFVAVMAYFSIVHHLTNLYIQEHANVEEYILRGPLASLFWVGHVLVGIILPVVLLAPALRGAINSKRFLAASSAVLLGGFALMYTIVIGSQSTPQRLFPGQVVTESRFGDAPYVAYAPSGWELGLGLGGIGVALFLALMALRVLPFAPRIEMPVPEATTVGAAANPGSSEGARDGS